MLRLAGRSASFSEDADSLAAAIIAFADRGSAAWVLMGRAAHCVLAVHGKAFLQEGGEGVLSAPSTGLQGYNLAMVGGVEKE